VITWADHPRYTSLTSTLVQITRAEGFFRLYRGISVIVAGAIPSHAVYFATYELAKSRLGSNAEGHHFIKNGLAGALATMAHDAVVTPLDVIKQRLQMYNSSYMGFGHCLQRTLQQEGVRALYASYPTTVMMNVPFMSVHFATYEFLKRLLSQRSGDGTLEHMLAGGGAGALGGLVSNPLDVVKTRIQLHDHSKGHNPGAIQVFKTILKDEGSRALMKGTTARVVYFIPSAAICWTTYESMKKLLLR